MEVQDSKWREYTGKVPEPRPGSVSVTYNHSFFSGVFTSHSYLLLSSLQCITDLHRSQGVNSSRDLPDNVLTFARRHPLMASQVHPVGVRPLMFKRSVNYVKIAVHKEPALDGNIYTVLFLGTGELYSRKVNKAHKKQVSYLMRSYLFFQMMDGCTEPWTSVEKCISSRSCSCLINPSPSRAWSSPLLWYVSCRL